MRFLCGVPITVSSHGHVLRELQANIEGARLPQAVSITNTESMYFAVRSKEHGAFISSVRLSLCDGMGVVIAGRAWGHRIPRFNGPVFMEKACEYGVPLGWRHFFYGGKPGVPETLAERLCARFPGLQIGGCYSPPFRPVDSIETGDVLIRIQDARPDIVWVGLGLLKQERWIANHMNLLQVPWLAGVGAAFDFHAGTARWAPHWIQKAGFEWLYRLCFEPRMLKRNVRSFIFLGQAVARGLSYRLAPRPESSDAR